MNSSKICPDGSDRKFFRTRWNQRPAVIIDPAPGSQGMKEALSFFFIGSHLFSRGVSVPEIYLFDRDSGRLVVEDLGDVRLQDEALAFLTRGNFKGLEKLYVKAVETLAAMQARGTRGFDAKWCWQEPFYDSKLALEREGLYFLGAFLRSFMGLDFSEKVLKKELEGLALLVDNYDIGTWILHRDFQSRNLMIRDETVFIIDFQAARLGPPGYDLASLLHDPYVNMPWSLRSELFDFYCSKMKHIFREKVFARQFHLVSILRLLQALGAYGFLIKSKGRDFFRPFIPPALQGLASLLEDWQLTDCTELRRCIRAARLS